MLQHRTAGERIFDALLYALLTVAAISTVYPFLYLLVLSLNETTDALKGGLYLLPRKFTLENYLYVFQNDKLVRATINSVLRTVIQTVLSVFCCGMLAYVLSRRDFIFRKLFSFILVITIYVSGGLIPTYLLIKSLGLMNTFAVYIVPGIVSAFYIFVMRTFFEQLPEGLVESAYIDGANDFRIYTLIILRISLPVVATVALYVAVNEWNSWFDNYLYNSRNEKLAVLQYELQKMIQTVETNSSDSGDNNGPRIISPMTIKATLTILVTLPILFVYPFLQKYFVKGLTLGAMKD
ncbi:carbohydrate ABC transporter permease [Paenibacillus aurantius]|uniref:Carbohydrate ABC transporter permease n=1 Tax=Paenibacillus aurantius TaxID=2918900 RepID=A0AA96LEF9_9BACL|nr:carbohydrate ABC transporter permease [Paenibacillus aurantius]WJH32175.1 carbohydrate ABC transporter permease [Paenibacillus sp. CC-CFT747]WNQ12549.1 carbohydrate ABC transporter permease [Paenibacillus aurantius]